MRKSNGRTLWAAVALAALVALPAVSQEPAKAPAVATMRTAPGGVSWAPLVSYDKLVLTVQGGEFSSTREFTGGGVYFAPVDPEGYQLPDGTYNWEITVIRPALELNRTVVRSDQRWDNGRSQKAGTAPEALVQSGTFTIAHGAIVDPGLIEPESEPTPERAAAEVDDSDAANP